MCDDELDNTRFYNYEIDKYKCAKHTKNTEEEFFTNLTLEIAKQQAKSKPIFLSQFVLAKFALR